jgi:hypothetical protein
METFVIPLFVLLGIGAGLAFVWGAPIFGVPLLVLALIAAGAWMFGVRAKRSGGFQDEVDRATSDGPDFSSRDQETLTHQ